MSRVDQDRASAPAPVSQGPPRKRLVHVRRSRWAVTLTGCLLLCLAALVLAIMAGTSSVGVGDVIRSLVGMGSAKDDFIVFELRLPRAAGAVLIGAALAVAGALSQTFARNPLATPDIIGVTSGASVGAVAVIVLAGGADGALGSVLSLGKPVVAIVSGLISAAIIYLLAFKEGVDSFRLVLVGIGATAAFTGITTYLVSIAKLDISGEATQWLTGSLSGVGWEGIVPVIIALAVCLPVALIQTSALDITQLGDDVSSGLGISLQRHRAIVLTCVVVLSATAVAAAGPIEFVAFVAPQIVMRLAGTARPPLLASGLMGGIIVALADTVGRTVLPWKVPVGIITAIIGAPYLIWLIIRASTQEKSE